MYNQSADSVRVCVGRIEAFYTGVGSSTPQSDCKTNEHSRVCSALLRSALRQQGVQTMRWGVGTESLEPKDKSGQPAVNREAGRKMMLQRLPIDR